MKVLPFRSPNKMERDEEDLEIQPRSIRLPQFVWEALDVDAARCRRSAVRQIEAILVRYYDLVADIELNEEKLSQAAKSVSRKRKAG